MARVERESVTAPPRHFRHSQPVLFTRSEHKEHDSAVHNAIGCHCNAARLQNDCFHLPDQNLLGVDLTNNREGWRRLSRRIVYLGNRMNRKPQVWEGPFLQGEASDGEAMCVSQSCSADTCKQEAQWRWLVFVQDVATGPRLRHANTQTPIFRTSYNLPSHGLQSLALAEMKRRIFKFDVTSPLPCQDSVPASGCTSTMRLLSRSPWRSPTISAELRDKQCHRQSPV
ncbi:uncharacterized protein MYCFIDRAFT_176687 [Pseudocercospora fijiensis CIRAD86]|uniref:Uncharacterized protein n=1 Tax=Pseudocercospora fijiensis (strain CIRAD86) TaxID=383855 RepID=M2YUJ7_PSEFD|nr:uncharacterized protein MYCFIDRAFT_176687 [Pseudocercospora fijiensis CIRAD86]EME81410.1 hypothetical protein MYCFIDRAFT_176687 [Pseudocercospora fijiensis CIRAD86]